MKRWAGALVASATYLTSTADAGAQTWGRVYPTLSFASEYRHDGVSNSSGRPVAQASLYWLRPDHFYAGLFATGVDFSGFHDETTSYEIDVYAGRNWDFDMGGKTRFTLEAMYSAFPDSDVQGPTYNFFQAKARVQHRIGALTLDALLSFTPEASFGSGQAWRYEAGASHKPAYWLTIDGAVGVRYIERGADRTYWDIGATAAWRSLSFDLRYVDTDLSFIDCGFTTNCSSATVGKLSWNIPINENR